MNEYARRWIARNDETNGTLLANIAASAAGFAVALLAIVFTIQLLLSPINNDPAPAPAGNPTTIELTYTGNGIDIKMVPSAFAIRLDGPSSDETTDGNLADDSYDSKTLDAPPSDTPFYRDNADVPFDPYGKDYSPQGPFGTRDLPYINPDENTPYYSDPQRQAADHAISVAVYGGCFTNSGRYQLVLDGFTPFGKYMAQTDWDGNGNFGYGDVNIADAYGRAVFNWSCFDATGIELPWGMYDVHFTDLSSGFGRTFGLRVD